MDFNNAREKEIDMLSELNEMVKQLSAARNALSALSFE